MYLKKAVIEKIKSIEHFEMDFKKPAGWHVIIGDNGSGKSTIIRSIALALVGPEEAQGLRADWRDWLNRQSDMGSICLEINGDTIDKSKKQGRKPEVLIVKNQLEFKRNGTVSMKARSLPKGSEDPKKYNWEKLMDGFLLLMVLLGDLKGGTAIGIKCISHNQSSGPIYLHLVKMLL